MGKTIASAFNLAILTLKYYSKKMMLLDFYYNNAINLSVPNSKHHVQKSFSFEFDV